MDVRGMVEDLTTGGQTTWTMANLQIEDLQRMDYVVGQILRLEEEGLVVVGQVHHESRTGHRFRDAVTFRKL